MLEFFERIGTMTPKGAAVLRWARQQNQHPSVEVSQPVCAGTRHTTAAWSSTRTTYRESMDQLVGTAALIAEMRLAGPLPRRWRHVRAVAAKAHRLAQLVPVDDRELLVAAAWLHDIGYAPDIADTGLHSLDGARWLMREGFSPRLASLVAHHSCAAFEAEERGLGEDLAIEFPPEHSVTADVLWFVDMTTGPDGQDLTAEERLAEIRTRYGPDDIVSRFWRRAEPALMEAVRRTQARMAAHPMYGSLRRS